MKGRILLALALAASVAHAQTDGGRYGLSISAGGGIGDLRLTCDGCPNNSPPVTSTAWFARIGYAASPRVVAGIGIDRWFKNGSFDKVSPSISGGTRESRHTWYTASLQAYPIARGVFRGAYGRGAFGIAAYNTTAVYDTLFTAAGYALNETRRFSAKDLGGSVGIGLDVPIIWDATVGAYANYFFAMRGDMTASWGPTGTRIGSRMFNYGVALTVR